MLAEYVCTGHEIQCDDRVGLEWLLKAVEQNYSKAQRQVGMLHDQGELMGCVDQQATD